MTERFYLQRVRAWKTDDCKVYFVRNESQNIWEIRSSYMHESRLIHAAQLHGQRHGGLPLRGCIESVAAVTGCSPRLLSWSIYRVISSDGLGTGIELRKVEHGRWAYSWSGRPAEGSFWYEHQNEIINRLIRRSSRTRQEELRWFEETIALVESICQLNACVSSELVITS